MQSVDRFIDGSGRGERPKILSTPISSPTVFGDLGPFMISGYEDVRKGFVVSKQDVIARLQLLYEV